MKRLVFYTAVFSIVTPHQWGGALRDDTKNGCVADYETTRHLIKKLIKSKLKTFPVDSDIQRIFTLPLYTTYSNL